MAFKRLPNGVGTVTKEKGKRRNPWRAMKPIGRKVGASGKVYMEYIRIGSFATRSEAVKALMDYADKPVHSRRSFDSVFQAWKETRTAGWSSTHAAAYKHLKPLHYKDINSIKALDLERIVNSDSVPRTMKNYCATILHGVFDYAVRHEYVDKNYAEMAKFNYDNETRIKRKVFTKEEIEGLWENTDDFYVRATLILLYTGMRVTELSKLKIEDIHLDESYVVGGIKTEAGKNRIIPIHPDIMPLILRQLEIGGEYLMTSDRGFVVNEANLFHHMKRFEIPHSPHDTRHTYATQAFLCGMDENIVKRILGHRLPGVTQQVYIHLKPEEIVKENLKLHY